MNWSYSIFLFDFDTGVGWYDLLVWIKSQIDCLTPVMVLVADRRQHHMVLERSQLHVSIRLALGLVQNLSD
jgi:hypothetical protein